MSTFVEAFAENSGNEFTITLIVKFCSKNAVFAEEIVPLMVTLYVIFGAVENEETTYVDGTKEIFPVF